MNTLQTEFHRLYLLDNPPSDVRNLPGSQPVLIDAGGRVRAMVLEVAQLAGCECVVALWHGAQDALGLPAPAVAVSGTSGYQLWFSVREAVPAAQAMAFLDLLRLRFLPEVAPRYVAMWPVADASGQLQHAKGVPALQADTSHWSAFVAPGLISMFADEPWLDLPPSAEAQAKLLANFESVSPAGFGQALARLQPTSAATASDAGLAPVYPTGQTKAHEGADPKRFLLTVMNDPTTELGLRIEAAKALLPYYEAPWHH